jgi:hypothetical protein
MQEDRMSKMTYASPYKGNEKIEDQRVDGKRNLLSEPLNNEF